MHHPAPATWDAAALAELFAAVRAGSSEALGALEDDPLLVVDLDSCRGRPPVEIPRSLPCVVVGVARDARGACPTTGVDVALCEDSGGDVPVPWVRTGSISDAASRLSAVVGTSPLASVVLVQVLRAGTGDLEADLVTESIAYSMLQAGPEHAAWLAHRTPPRRAPRELEGPDPADPLLVERRGGVAVLTLHRPHVRNALDARLRDALCAALATHASDPAVERIELHGTGPDFCSGGDLAEFGTRPDPVTGHLVRTVRSVARSIAVSHAPVTAHLHGACVGAGIELAAAARHVEAGPDTRVLLPEVGMGLIPGAGGTATIPSRIGRHRTAWLALSGEALDAESARRWGLVDELVGGTPG